MSMKSCCVPSCKKRRDGLNILHLFPNPDQDLDRFNIWRNTIGEPIISLDPHQVFKLRRVCRHHFEPCYYTRSKRLNANAVPTLHLPTNSLEVPKDVPLHPAQKGPPKLSFLQMSYNKNKNLGPNANPTLHPPGDEKANSPLEVVPAQKVPVKLSFLQVSCNKNKNLSPNANPTLRLPGEENANSPLDVVPAQKVPVKLSFLQVSCNKNKNLSPNANPTLRLPGEEKANSPLEVVPAQKVPVKLSFLQVSCNKNKNLSPNANPTLRLPGEENANSLEVVPAQKDPLKLSFLQVYCNKNKNLSPNTNPTLHLPGDENANSSLEVVPAQKDPLSFLQVYCNKNKNLSPNTNPTLHLPGDENANSFKVVPAQKDPVKLSFLQVSCKKDKNVSPNANPTLHLPGDENELNKSSPPAVHEGVFCNNCKQEIKGFRYKCVTCEDYDLCMRCEMQEVHPNHFMLRISRQIKIKIADNLIEKWRLFFKAEHITVSQCDFLGNHSDSDTNDEDSITKGTNTADSLLPNDIKDQIREEVSRVIKENKVEKIIKPRIRNKLRKDKDMSSSCSVAEATLQPVNLSSEQSTPYTNKIIAKRKNVDLHTATSTQNLYEIEKLNEKMNTNPMLDRRKKPKLITVSNIKFKLMDSSKQQLYSSKQPYSSKQQLYLIEQKTTPNKQQMTSQPYSIEMQQ